MSVTTDGLEDLRAPRLTATQAGGMATMAASQTGLASSVVAGFVSLVVGIFIGVAVAPPRR